MKAKKFWQFKAKKDEPQVGELLLYGDISSSSWWGDEITPKQFKEDLDALGEISELNIFVNSGGGDVFAGQAIRSILKRHNSLKTGYVDGIAASIASVILTACDKVVMPLNSMQMIHKAWTFAIGNADEMRKLADDMDKIDESIIAAYVDKTGQEREKIIQMMSDETWMTAEEAFNLGFADEIEDQKQVAASMKNGKLVINGQEIDLSRFSNAPGMAKKQKPAPVCQGILFENPGKSFSDEGKTLSAANENRIVQARDLLEEVLGQTGANENKVPEDSEQRAAAMGLPKDKSEKQPAVIDSAVAKLKLQLELML